MFMHVCCTIMLFQSKLVCISFICGKNYDILKNADNQTLTCSVKNILQNIFIYVPQKKQSLKV